MTTVSASASIVPSQLWSDVVDDVVENTTSDEYISSDVRLADSYGTLKLYHYVHCDDSSSAEIARNRGVIRDGDTVLLQTFGYTREISSVDESTIVETVGDQSYTVYTAEEGATIRLWCYKGDWLLSTHRKINAFSSRWGSSSAQSFGDMFISALQWECAAGSQAGNFESVDMLGEKSLFNQYCATLDPRKNYTFLVRNSVHNRIVCDAPHHATAYYTGAFDTTTHELVVGNDSGFPTPRMHEFKMISDMVSFVQSVDYRESQGVIVYLDNGTQFKIMKPQYLDLFAARGNEPSIKYRYLGVRSDRCVVDQLHMLYPDYIDQFNAYERALNEVGTRIYRSYVSRYIRREFTTVDQQEYFIMKLLHAQYMSTRVKISIGNVHDMISHQSATSLNHLIKNHIKAQHQV